MSNQKHPIRTNHSVVIILFFDSSGPSFQPPPPDAQTREFERRPKVGKQLHKRLREMDNPPRQWNGSGYTAARP